MFADDKGILRVESLDSVAPLHTVLNTLMESVSESLNNIDAFYPVSSVTERNQLLEEEGAPLFVIRTDINAVEYTLDGEDWLRFFNKDTVIEREQVPFGAVLLDEIDLEGGTSPTRTENMMTIPEEHRGKFKWYRVIIQAAADAVTNSNIRPVCLRFNRDSGANYRSMISSFNDGGINEGDYLASTAYPRTTYIGIYDSVAHVDIHPRVTPSTTYYAWTSTSHAAGASNSSNNISGGRWGPSPGEVLETVTVGTNSSSVNWKAYASAQLWGFR